MGPWYDVQLEWNGDDLQVTVGGSSSSLVPFPGKQHYILRKRNMFCSSRYSSV